MEKKRISENERSRRADTPGFLIILSDWRSRGRCVYACHISPLATQASWYRVIELSGKLPLTENGSAIVVAAADDADAIVVA